MNPRLKRTLAALAVSATTLTVSAAATGTAGAAVGPSAAPAAGPSEGAAAAAAILVCEHAQFSECGWVAVTVKDAGKTWWGSRWQDSISSIQNLTTATMCFWEHNNFQGRSFVVKSGYSVTDLGGTVFNDAVSSWKPC
ncbi:peptidase inhibitor family I36 protein [Kitasatospora sp. NPDC056327]|uniref:peptidase inhibitor family I36 protein n=1 Tax=Kitasatospora sp. NPDC056327 TaxID=3345785 RepID=UPI0035E39B56